MKQHARALVRQGVQRTAPAGGARAGVGAPQQQPALHDGRSDLLDALGSATRAAIATCAAMPDPVDTGVVIQDPTKLLAASRTFFTASRPEERDSTSQPAANKRLRAKQGVLNDGLRMLRPRFVGVPRKHKQFLLHQIPQHAHQTRVVRRNLGHELDRKNVADQVVLLEGGGDDAVDAVRP